jgi:uncharacterized repeat protein (TIGR01451 family)
MQHIRLRFWLMAATLALAPVMALFVPANVDAFNSNSQTWTPVAGPSNCPPAPVAPFTSNAVFSVSNGSNCGGTGTTFDTAEIFPPAVIRDTASATVPCESGRTSGICYRMWYVGVDGSNSRRIGYAVGPDGVNWTRVPGSLTGGAVFQGSGVANTFDVNGTTTMTVLKDSASADTPCEGGRTTGDCYRMWYTGRGTNDAIEGIGYAVSPNGVNWTRINGTAGTGATNINAVLVERGGAGNFDGSYIIGPYVMRDTASAAVPCENGRTSGTCYRMWYEGASTSNVFTNGYAVSPDGINWTIVLGNAGGGAVLAGSGFGSGFDENVVGLPMVLREGNIFHMWYQAKDFSDNAFRIGHVTSPDGVNWVRPEPNDPVFEADDLPSTAYVDRVWVHRIQKEGATYRMWYATSDQVGSPGSGSDSDRFGLVQMTPGTPLTGVQLTRTGSNYTLSFNMTQSVPAGGAISPTLALNPQVLITLPSNISLDEFVAGSTSGFTGATMSVSAVSDVEVHNRTRPAIAVNLPNGATTGPKSISFSLGSAPIPANLLVQVFDTHKVVQRGELTIADLQITKTDGATTQVAGTQVTYTVVVSNPSSNTVNGATVSDTLPASLTGVSWTCSGANGATCPASGSGNLSSVAVNLPGGSSATFTVVGTLSSTATGTLNNTATVTAPAGINDPTSSNNSAADSSSIVLQADLRISLTRTTDPVVAGSPVSYTIVVSNTGPSSASSVPVVQTLPAEITNLSWSCTATGAGASCPANGSGAINTQVNLPPNTRATFTASGIVPGSWTGNLGTSANVSAPGSLTDTNPANNTANDTVGTVQQADLQIVKSIDPTTVVPGEQVTYTIIVTNAGPSDVSGATVVDTFPDEITGVTWTCTATAGSSCPASGSGDINATVNLTATHIVTFTAVGTVQPSARGILANTASVLVPGGIQDTDNENNSSTRNDALTPRADLSLTLQSSPATLVPGLGATYTIVVSNAGPSDAVDASVVDIFPTAFTSITWACVASGGASCPANGAGNIETTVDVPVGGSVTFTINGTIDSAATGNLVTSASVTVAADEQEVDSDDNSAESTRTLSPRANLAVQGDGGSSKRPGANVSQVVTITNAGPSAALGSRLQATIPAALTGASWTCAATPGSSCATASGTGNVDIFFNLAVGGQITLTINGVVAWDAKGSIISAAAASVAVGTVDPNTGNNSSTAATRVTNVVHVPIAVRP